MVSESLDSEMKLPVNTNSTLPTNDCSDKREEAENASGFTVLHQAAFNNANPEFVQMLVNYGAWSRSSFFSTAYITGSTLYIIDCL